MCEDYIGRKRLTVSSAVGYRVVRFQTEVPPAPAVQVTLRGQRRRLPGMARRERVRRGHRMEGRRILRGRIA